MFIRNSNMKLYKVLYLITLLIMPFSANGFTVRNVVLNGSFEEGLAEDGERPLWWYIGFPGDAPITSMGDWYLDSSRLYGDVTADGVEPVFIDQTLLDNPVLV